MKTGITTQSKRTSVQTSQWTAVDQTRVDAFEQQILCVASQLQGGHPDVIVLSFVQTLGSLMRQRLLQDPTRLGFYQRALVMLTTHVKQSVPSDHEAKH